MSLVKSPAKAAQKGRVSHPFHRRAALRLLGLGVGFGVAFEMGCGGEPPDGDVVPAGSRQSANVPDGAIIRTILGDVRPADVSGSTLMHEHLGTGHPEEIGDNAGKVTNPTQDAAWMTEELTAAKAAGLGCIVAAQTSMPGTANVAYLTQLAWATGLHIVAAGSYYHADTYPPGVATKRDEEIADDLVRGAQEGHLGAFGEVGMTNNVPDLDPLEKKVFRAMALAQQRTGLPIFTHTNYSTGEHVSMDAGLKQLDILEAAGATLQNVAIGHVCCLDDPMVAVAKRIAQRGAFVAFDRVTRQQQWVPDARKVIMVKALLDAGLIDRLLISSDYIGRVNTSVGEINAYGPLHTREGGPGYARPMKLFMPLLRKAGVSDAAIHQLTVENPRRFLAFVPVHSKESSS